jgi:hypothetical protein
MFGRGQVIGLKQKVCVRPVLIPAAILLLAALRTPAQTAGVTPRITQAVDEKKLVVLQGNIHPLTRAALDLGAVSDTQPLTRMLLLLKRSPDQELALLRLLDEQQTKSSPNYHRWLTPEQFGQQFGPADADIRAVTDWLQSQGFQVTQVTKGRTVIEFSGNVAQVRNAFHTQIHRYSVNGQEHIANATDPQIPAALAPAVVGVVSLHNFRPASHLRYVGAFHRSTVTGEVTPLFTPIGSSSFFPLAPGDFAKIYNVAPLLNASPPIDGSGQTIAIVGESNIRVQDIIDFRNLFGLPQNFTGKNVILNGPDPGINESEGESDLDIQWAGGAAPGATIDFVTSAPTETTSGIHLSAVYVVDNNLAGGMSESFGECEQNLGSVGNQFYDSLWEQAAAQGITVILSAGDGGSAGCDNFHTRQPAKQGLAVSGFASTPFNVAVGGTDFDQTDRWSQYWNPTNDPVTHASVKGYIPEIPWNDSCAQLGINGCGPSAPQGSLNIVAGSGGPSTLYPKPAWQSSAGVPQDNKRDLPDVSLFASNGFTGSFYIMCQSDVVTPPSPSCTLDNFGFTFQGTGGTSVGAPAFAGMMALVNQKQATSQNPTPRQGNANYVLYALARKQAVANLSCNSSAGPDSGCAFNDVTKGNSALANSSIGNNSVPCSGGSPNCSSGASGVNGVLVDPANRTNPAWTTNAGYDMATGLGSVNAQNLVNNWNSVTFLPSTTTLSASINGKSVSSISGLVHGQAISVTSTVGPGSGATGTPAGQVALIASPNPASGSPSPSLGVEVLALANGTAMGANVVLPGGTYALTGHYQGDGTFGPSDSSPAIPVNITAENSKTLISIPVFDPATGRETGNTPSSVTYGSPYAARMDVGNAQAALSFPPQPTCNPPSCPTGTITLTDAFNGGAPAALDGGTFALNSAGFAEDFVIQLPGGSHQLSAGYGGDSSFGASSATYTLTVTPTPTTTTIDTNDNASVGTVGVPFGLNILTRSNSSGVVPTGTYTVFDGGSAVNGTSVIGSGQPGSSVSGAFLQGGVTFTFSKSGPHVLTAAYSGDSNYAGSTSTNSFTVNVNNPTTTTISASSLNIIAGNPITLTAIVDTTVKSPTPSQNVVFYGTGDGYFPGTVTYTSITDAGGNAASQASLTVTPLQTEQLTAIFNGDANYASSSSAPLNITVVTPDFTFGPDSSTLTVTAGQTGTLPLTLTPATNLTSSVKLSINNTGMPAGSTYSFTPNPATLSNSVPSTVVFSVTVPAPPPSPGAKALSVKRAALVPLRRGGWLAISLATGLGMVALLLLPGRRRFGTALGLGLVCALTLGIGCGGGGGSGGGGGGGGGGGPQLVGTTTAITSASSKVAFPNSVQFTVTVTPASGSTPPTGTVDLVEVEGNIQSTQTLPLSNGQAQLQIPALRVGAHAFFGKYNGDTHYQPSTSATLTQIITGSTPVGIIAVTGRDAHQIFVTVTVQ